MSNSRTVVAMIGGALVGSVAGYLFFTERGRALRREIEPALEEFAHELRRFRDTVQQAVSVAAEGWDAITENAVDDRGSRFTRVH
jgi:gas vesicle protein